MTDLAEKAERKIMKIDRQIETDKRCGWEAGELARIIDEAIDEAGYKCESLERENKDLRGQLTPIVETLEMANDNYTRQQQVIEQLVTALDSLNNGKLHMLECDCPTCTAFAAAKALEEK